MSATSPEQCTALTYLPSYPLHTLAQYKTLLTQSNDTLQQSAFYHTCQQRYAPAQLAQRLSLFTDVVCNELQSVGFVDDQPLVIVSSPGRDRICMGHTDLTGLGGFTVDCATAEEICCFLQLTGGGHCYCSNSEAEMFPATEFTLHSILDVAAAHATTYGQRNYDTAQWCSYIKAALTYLCCPRFMHSSHVLQRLSGRGFRFHVVSRGTLSLPYSGGMSSSAALTGGFSMSLLQALQLTQSISLECLSTVDYGEYFLGKFAGCADKLAQLFAVKDRVTQVGSFPERLIQSFPFPTAQITLLIADSDCPRLTLTNLSRPYLLKHYSAVHTEHILQWASEVMYSFGSLAYVKSVEALLQSLRDPQCYAAAGFSDAESAAVIAALTVRNDSTGEDMHLLRELCTSGQIETLLPQLSGWSNRHARYELIYRLLTLIPEQQLHTDNSGTAHTLYLRKAALYGLSELERGVAYLRELQWIDAHADAPTAEIEQHMHQLLHLVRCCHDGDKACVDHRTLLDSKPAPTADGHIVAARNPHDYFPFPFAAWHSDQRNSVSSERLQHYRSSSAELCDIPGGFERSLVDIDELADELHAKFENRVAVRISAAGLGSRICIHAFPAVVPELTKVLELRGFHVRVPVPSSPTMIMPL